MTDMGRGTGLLGGNEGGAEGGGGAKTSLDGGDWGGFHVKSQRPPLPQSQSDFRAGKVGTWATRSCCLEGNSYSRLRVKLAIKRQKRLNQCERNSMSDRSPIQMTRGRGNVRAGRLIHLQPPPNSEFLLHEGAMWPEKECPLNRHWIIDEGPILLFCPTLLSRFLRSQSSRRCLS